MSIFCRTHLAPLQNLLSPPRWRNSHSILTRSSLGLHFISAILCSAYRFAYVHFRLHSKYRGGRFSMANNMNARELSDEQLEAVTGGSTNLFSNEFAGNGLLQLNLAVDPTVNVSVFNFGDLSQTGATTTQSN